MLKLITILMLISPSVFAVEAGPCMDASLKINHALFQAWALADVDVRGPGRDAVWSTKEFSKPYTEIMKQIPGKFTRTKGVFQELQDRVTYTYKASLQTPWQNRYVHAYIAEAYQCLYRELARCYANSTANNPE